MIEDNMAKGVCVCVCVCETGSLCCTAEIGTTLQINYNDKRVKEKSKNPLKRRRQILLCGNFLKGRVLKKVGNHL